MGRSGFRALALLFLGATPACRPSSPAAPALHRTPSPPSRSAEALGPGASETDPLRRLVSQRLERIAATMAPVCTSRCGSVVALPDPTLSSVADAAPSAPGIASIIHYRPDVLQREFDFYDALASYTLAHEYGHHLDVTMRSDASADAWEQELRADALAGCALARGGDDLEAVRRFLSGAMAPDGSMQWHRQLRCGTDGRHPASEWSLEAVNAGARLCGAEPPLLLEITAATEPIVAAAHRSAADAAASPWYGAEPCEPDAAEMLRLLERSYDGPG